MFFQQLAWRPRVWSWPWWLSRWRRGGIPGIMAPWGCRSCRSSNFSAWSVGNQATVKFLQGATFKPTHGSAWSSIERFLLKRRRSSTDWNPWLTMSLLTEQWMTTGDLAHIHTHTYLIYKHTVTYCNFNTVGARFLYVIDRVGAMARWRCNHFSIQWCAFSTRFFELRFRDCCQRALTSVFRLASLLTGKSEAAVESQYRKTCHRLTPDKFLFEDEEIDDDELMPGEMPSREDKPPEDRNEALQVLECLQSETVFVDPEMPEELDASNVPDPDWNDVSDQAQFQTLLEQPEVMLPDSVDKALSPQGHETGERMPWTLREALSMNGCPFNALFRLTVRIRSSRGGIDCSWVRNARHVRRASQNLNWHQLLGMQSFF